MLSGLLDLELEQLVEIMEQDLMDLNESLGSLGLDEID